jgi:hypothetical protein
MDLRTLNPSIRRLGGIYTITETGEDMPKQPPAIINPRAIRKATRARGEEASIPQVEIYIETDKETGDVVPREEMTAALAGQKAAPERVLTYAQKEAKRRVATRKDMIEAEKEVLEAKLVKKLEKEKPQKVVKGGVVTDIVPFVDKDKTKKEIAEIKLKKAEAKAKKAVAEAFAEGARAETAKTYLQFANQRARELQAERGVKWQEAKAIATDEWKKRSVKEPAGYYITDVESSDKGKKAKKPAVTAIESESKSDGTIGSYKSKSDGTIPDKKITPKPKTVTIKRKDGTTDVVERKKEKLAEEQKKAEAIKLTPSEPAKEKREKLASQKNIIAFVSSLSNEEVKNEYRTLHPRKEFPSFAVMRNAIIKSLGGRVRGGKYEFVTSEEE